MGFLLACDKLKEMMKKVAKIDFFINKKLNKLVFIGELCNLRGNPWNRERVREWLKKTGGNLSNFFCNLLIESNKKMPSITKFFLNEKSSKRFYSRIWFSFLRALSRAIFGCLRRWALRSPTFFFCFFHLNNKLINILVML